MSKKVSVAALGVLAIVVVADVRDIVGQTATPRLSAPRNLRVLSSEISPAEPAPTAACNPVAVPGNTKHAYFDSLVVRQDCLRAYSMRSQAELESVRTAARAGDRKPITYDTALDAARITIYGPATPKSQQKLYPMQVRSGSLLLTWDFRFDEHFAYVSKGNLDRHKTWRLDPESGIWLALKTDYRNAAQASGVAELFLSLPSQRFLAPGTTRGTQEILFPRLQQFFIEPNRWTRVWLFIENIEGPTSYVSFWAADEQRDPVQLYDRIALVPDVSGLDIFRVEYDVSSGPTTNPNEMHSWNRNLVFLHNVAAAEVARLLQRPL